jgi:hypothetical protein
LFLNYSRLKVMGNNLYAACLGGNGWVEVFSIAPSGALTFTSYARPGPTTAMQAWDIAFTGQFMFVAQGTAAPGMPYFQLTDPNNPAFLGTFDTSGGATHNVTALDATWDYVYTAGAYGFQVIPFDQSTVPAIPLTVLGNSPTHVVVQGTRALVSDLNGTTSIDISNPRAPTYPQSSPPFFQVAGPALFQDGYVVGPSPQNQTDGIRWLRADSGSVAGTMPFAQCAQYGSNSSRTQLVYSDGVYYSTCQSNGIQMVSPVNPFHGGVIWDDSVSSAWGNSGSNALALDHVRAFFSAVGTLNDLWTINTSDDAAGSFPTPSFTSSPVPTQAVGSLTARGGILYAATSNSVTEKIEPFEITQEAAGPITAMTPLTLTGGPIWHEPADDGRYLWVPATAQIDVVDTDTLPSALALKTPVAPEAGFTFNGQALAYRGRLYGAETGATTRIGVWDVTTPTSPAVKTAITTPQIPSIIFRVSPTAVAGSVIFYSYQAGNGAYGWGMSQLSSDGDGKTTGVTTPTAFLYSFPSTSTIKEMVLAGDTLLVQENLAVSIYDLTPFWRRGASPMRVGGQTLPDPAYNFGAKPVLKLEGPFAFLSANRLRVFDLR